MNTENTKRICKPFLPTHLSLLLAAVLLAGCNSTTVKTAAHEEILTDDATTPEDLILDVGIGIFDPGVTESDEKEGVHLRIREAEARYMPNMMKNTLQQTGNWGAVRVIPDRQSEMDVWVDAKILKSDGENLALQVQVEDATGKVWFNRKYTDRASKFAYDGTLDARAEPFQGLYNKVANDMLQYRKRLKPNALRTIRTVAELKFAKEFAPEFYEGHLQTDSRGRHSISRLPAENDSVLDRIRRIRERDYVFVDTLQQYYDSFSRQMQVPYMEWREAFYIESQALKEVRSQARARTVGGALAVLAGILAQGSGSRTARAAGVVGIGAGAAAVQSGLHKFEQAKIHVEALEEISSSLNAEIEPHTVKLENRTVTLTGTVQEQYQQWQELLKEIYTSETGIPVPAESAEPG
ncbi:MAG: hypothetical protein ACR2P9_07465 [Gammaproteobacteria bacterium]